MIPVSDSVGEKTLVGLEIHFMFLSTSLEMRTHAYACVVYTSKQNSSSVLFGDVMNNKLWQCMSPPYMDNVWSFSKRIEAVELDQTSVQRNFPNRMRERYKRNSISIAIDIWIATYVCYEI